MTAKFVSGAELLHKKIPPFVGGIFLQDYALIIRRFANNKVAARTLIEITKNMLDFCPRSYLS